MQGFRERWHHMSQRERTLVLAGGIVLGLSLLFILIIDPLLDNLDRLERQALRKQKDLAELAVLGQSYVAKRDRLRAIESRMPQAESHFFAPDVHRRGGDDRTGTRTDHRHAATRPNVGARLPGNSRRSPIGRCPTPGAIGFAGRDQSGSVRSPRSPSADPSKIR